MTVATAAVHSPCATSSAPTPCAATSGSPSQPVSANATPKNVPHRVIAAGRVPSELAAAISVGAVTTMARCAAPSSTRLASSTGSGGSDAWKSESAAPNASPPSSSRRGPTRTASAPASSPSSAPTTLIADTRKPSPVPASG